MKKYKENESSDSLMKDVSSINKKKKSEIFKANKRRKTKMNAKRAIHVNSNSDEISSKSTKRDDKSKSMIDAIMKMKHIRFIDSMSQFETAQITNQKRFEVEMLQRSQHHKEIMTKTNETILFVKMQHEKTMMRLKIKLKKTPQRHE